MIRHHSPPFHLTMLSLALVISVALVACNDDDNDALEVDDSDATDTSDAPDLLNATTSTAGVECDYVDVTYNDSAEIQAESRSSWTCSDATRDLDANGIPDHDVGPFGSGANERTISEQAVTASYPLDPEMTGTATGLGGPRGPTGYVLNGIKMDPGTAGTCNDTGDVCSLGNEGSGQWSIEALGQDIFGFGLDGSNAHVQPDGTYHYHGMPEAFIDKRGGGPDTMTLIGWAADGFPIYARYGYSDPMDASSPLVAMEGSYELVQAVDAARPPIDSLPLGTFSQDWEYVEGAGDLDECNGRVGVTPEFPSGTYHYFATDDYPYLHRCVRGEVEAPTAPPGEAP